MSQASRLLGVHPATLRHWANRGAIRTFVTPGGHRRFALEDLRALLTGGTAVEGESSRQLVQAALSRTRQIIGSSRLSGEAWYLTFNEKERERKREAGRRLLGLLMAHLSEGGRQASPALEEARLLGGEYGRDAAGRGLSLAETTRAFLFFRDFLLEAALQPSERGRGRSEQSLRTYREVNRFTNEVFLAAMSAYEEASRQARPTSS
ncbi:MAG: helix-turn-helix domain-containing protein [Chloroflexi bacterium]|nr:helix-turn-helix domain-containing protein [Chloroflexota bacterium]